MIITLFGSNSDVQLYSLAANNQLAFCALPYAAIDTLVHELPIGYTNLQVGEQAVVSFDRRRYRTTYIEHLYLTDHLLHITTDLLNEDYTFIPLATSNDTHFTITVVAKTIEQPSTGDDKVATAIKNSGNAVQTTAIYDLLGREYPVGTKLPQGVYIIVENNNVRKEFVR